MKKIAILVTLLLVFFTNSLFAVVAYPYPINFNQSDKTQITVTLKGDEKVNWG